MNTLLVRLSLAFGSILLLLGLMVWWITYRSNQAYFLEFTQQLNAPIAMYMAHNADLVDNGIPNPDSLEQLAPHVMMINPSVEVYLLDAYGRVIASASENKSVVNQFVNLEPILQFLEEDRVFPIRGDDPKHPDAPRIFSAFPLYEKSDSPTTDGLRGYVYAVLAGERHRSMLGSVIGSYSFKNLSLVLLGVLILALFSGVMVFSMLTRRLHILTSHVKAWKASLNLRTSREPGTQNPDTPHDEIDELSATYQTMATQLVDQYKALESNDVSRREFMANISHDLRTPLTTMQSYLETLLLKEHLLNADERRDYVKIAYRQSKHLRQLVAQLFTLTKLESGEVTAQMEKFCLLELAHDTCQEFQIKARRLGIHLQVRPPSSLGGEFEVCADIGMIHRVFENLVENALRHTPENGHVSISVQRIDANNVSIQFSDTGCGMTRMEQSNVVLRHYSGGSTASKVDGQSGLGLAIVRHILDLHETGLSLTSKLGQGTLISFTLPASQPETVPRREPAAQLAG